MGVYEQLADAINAREPRLIVQSGAIPPPKPEEGPCVLIDGTPGAPNARNLPGDGRTMLDTWFARCISNSPTGAFKISGIVIDAWDNLHVSDGYVQIFDVSNEPLQDTQMIIENQWSITVIAQHVRSK